MKDIQNKTDKFKNMNILRLLIYLNTKLLTRKYMKVKIT